MDSHSKWLRSSIPVVMAVAAIGGLIVAIFLIFTNPSRFPQGVTTTYPSPATNTPIIEYPQATSETGKLEATSQAQADLKSKLGISKELITVSLAESKTWSDSSLGCPQPGFFYAQVITPGYQIILQAQGKTYDYHTDASKRVVLCERTVNE